ncbi:hypothetical protein CERZMDRAFT_40698 [Cercospora zeae-maydis SCOH1-5]|uniref:Uncharacterized protein n=1 Tax=Cercospora zeae-maydis SCOH1-5 TaxID=717836 RepID=A0A6A6FHX4_9PEZI|nr:hypothetical protein CERZMDRAFT_40698 [Cercospora zeae-maydis SCOH1-5]
MTSPTTARPPAAEPSVDTSFNTSAHAARDDVESPSLTSGNALARFEFEPGRSKDGTKVLMVEWEEDDTTEAVPGDWEISWEGKRTVLPARDSHHNPATSSSQSNTTPADLPPVNRLYFLLGPGVTIPPTVKLQKGHAVTWRTNPLPAIFSPELGATARQAGKKGVLHTIWAKKRLQVLQTEIENESKENVEGIGLEMATAEKEWIEQHFGVVARIGNQISVQPPGQNPMGLALSGVQQGGGGLHSPSSPRSPGGGRLMDKLKGLRLGTSASDLTSSSGSPLQRQHQQQQQDAVAPDGADQHNPLSPEGTDVAVGGGFGSFAALKGMPPASSLAAKAPQQPVPPPASVTEQPAAPARRFVAQRPPEAFVAQQRQQAGGMGSLNAAFASPSGDEDTSFSGAAAPTTGENVDDEDDLFALPMSPRSPEMTKSPFSFAKQDTMRYLKEEQSAGTSS